MRITLRLDDEIGDFIKSMASKSKRSINRQIEWILGIHVSEDRAVKNLAKSIDESVVVVSGGKAIAKKKIKRALLKGPAVHKAGWDRKRLNEAENTPGLSALGPDGKTIIKGKAVRAMLAYSGIPEKPSHDPKTCRMKPCFMCEAMAAKK